MAKVKVITFEGLKKTHGELAEDTYRRIALAGGFGVTGGAVAPALDYTSSPADVQAEIDKILKEGNKK